MTGARQPHILLAWDRQDDAYLAVYQRLLGAPRAEVPVPAGVADLAGRGA
jgi:hypothetical protein